MNRPNRKTLRSIIQKMHKQNDYEKLAEQTTAASINMPVRINPCIIHQAKNLRSKESAKQRINEVKSQ